MYFQKQSKNNSQKCHKPLINKEKPCNFNSYRISYFCGIRPKRCIGIGYSSQKYTSGQAIIGVSVFSCNPVAIATFGCRKLSHIKIDSF